MSDQRLKNTSLTISLRLKEYVDEGSMPKLVELLLREGVVFPFPFLFCLTMLIVYATNSFSAFNIFY